MKEKIVSVIIGVVALVYAASCVVAGVSGQTFPAIMCGIGTGIFLYSGVKQWPK